MRKKIKVRPEKLRIHIRFVMLLTAVIMTLCCCGEEKEKNYLTETSACPVELQNETDIETNADMTTESTIFSTEYEMKTITAFILDNETEKLLNYKWDTDIFNTVSVSERADKYSEEEFLDKFIPKKWQDRISENNYWEKPFTSVYIVSGYTIIKHYEKEKGDIIGSAEGPEYYIIMDNDTFTYFYPVDFCQSPWFYISENTLYVFEKCRGLVQYYSLTQYNIDTGQIIEQITAYYDWAAIENIYRLDKDYFEDNKEDLYNGEIIYYSVPYINDLTEFEEYILQISDTWYV